MEIPKTLDKRTTLAFILALVIFGIIWRLAPHVPNFAPIGAIALIGGSLLGYKKSLAMLIVILFATDLLLGAYPGMEWTWLGFGLIVVIGWLIRSTPLAWRIPLGALGSSLVFFFVSNFGTWISSGMYTHDISGFIQCYVMALPFYRATLLSDLVFFSSLNAALYLLLQLRSHPTRRMSILHRSKDPQARELAG